MDLATLIEALGRSASYPQPVAGVKVVQTHTSVVFLAGPYAYKIKKPVALGFLDFSTLEKRRRFCEEEVRLNRRLAPAVYLGVVPVTRAAHAIRLEAPGEVIEWAVKMQRLPEDARLERHLLRQEAATHLMSALAGRVAAFHVTAAQGGHIAQFGRFEVVARDA